MFQGGKKGDKGKGKKENDGRGKRERERHRVGQEDGEMRREYRERQEEERRDRYVAV